MNQDVVDNVTRLPLQSKLRRLAGKYIVPANIRIDRVHIVIILLAVFAAHGLLLLNDGVYWDGWIFYTNVVDHDWQSLYQHWLNYGAPWNAYGHWLIGAFPDVKLGYRLVDFTSIVLFGVLVYAILKESELVVPSDGLWITLLTVSQPVFQIFLSQATATNIAIANPSLLLGILLALKSERADQGLRHLWRVLAPLFLAISFLIGHQYYLPYYYGFLLLLCLHIRQLHGVSIKYVLTKSLPRRLDYVFLPLLVWFGRQYFFPQQGVYAGEYSFVSSPITFLRASILFCFYIYSFLNNALKQALDNPLASLLVAVAVLQIGVILSPTATPSLEKKKTTLYVLLLFGLVLLVLGIFPFIATGRSPTMDGWNIRHAILIALPIAMILLAAVRLSFRGTMSRLGSVVMAMLVLGSTLTTISDYVSWQVRWIKDRSIMANLTELEGARDIAVYWINDQFPAGGERGYDFYEWAAMFKSIWNDEAHIGLNQKTTSADFLQTGRPYYTKEYILADFDPTGCQATLTIHPGPLPGNKMLIARYFYYRFLRPDKMAAFLAGVVELQIQPIEAPEAVNCHAK